MDGAVIEVNNLSKRFGSANDPRGVQAVNDVSFIVKPGRVLGFLGPNGSGKTTTLSMMLGLTRPDQGSATFDGVTYSDIDNPATLIGASLSPAFHPGHTGRDHLHIMRKAIGCEPETVDEALHIVGLTRDADRKSGGYSLGMRQRLALAGALLAEPGTLVLDEPANGLDPEGMRWMRLFLRHYASEGGTVVLSSHLLSEVAQTVDDLVVIRHGELVFTGTPQDLESTPEVGVESDNNVLLIAALEGAGAQVRAKRAHRFKVEGLDPSAIGQVALSAGVALTYLAPEHVGLEDRFLELIDTPAQEGGK